MSLASAAGLLWDILRDTFELMRKMYTIPRERYERNLGRFIELLEMGDFLDPGPPTVTGAARMRCELVASLLHDPKITLSMNRRSVWM
ncbi:MAG: hypothetical protein R2932_22805 [Caldilineaceae bacterium]